MQPCRKALTISRRRSFQMFCSNCGAKNRDGAKFCVECGAPLSRKADQAVATAPTDAREVPIASPAATDAQPTMQSTPPRTGGKSKRWIIPAVIVAALAAAALAIVQVVGVSVDGGPSSKGAVAVTGGTRIGSLIFGGTPMGNTASNYASGGLSVSDDSYDYFYSSIQGGICRAAKDGSSVDVISERESGWNGWASHFSLDGSTLFYENDDYSTNSTTYSVHAVNADGSNDRTIYSISSASNAGSAIEDVYLYDHMVYVLVSTLDSDTMRTTFGIWVMNEDGSNQHQAGGYTSDSGGGIPFLAKDKVYFCHTPPSSDGSSTNGEVYVQNYDGSETRKLYTSDVGNMYGTPFVVDDTIYVEEANNAQRIFNVVAMGLDGSDPHTVFSSTTANTWYNLVAVMHGCLYISHTDYDALVGSITRAPLDGGDTSEITLGQEYNLFMDDAGNHLLAIGIGYDMGSVGVDVASFDFEGNKLHDYVVDIQDADTDATQDDTDVASQDQKANTDTNEASSASTIPQTKTYRIIDQAMSWTDAENYCVQNGGELASITSQEEWDQVQALIRADGRGIFWIGGRRDSSGNFTWTDGSTFSFSSWADGEPNNDGGPEDYLVVYDVKGNLAWYDVPNDISSYYKEEKMAFVMETFS
ncbi:MAG: lectin-like protein [Atopobiaceae bacterium]